MILGVSSGAISHARVLEFVRTRDRQLNLELECSHPLFHLLETLLDVFPEAKIILTIRDCYSWLDSQLNSQLSYIETRPWQDFGDLKFAGESGQYPPEEQVLDRFGLYTLDGYLSAWAYHNNTVLTTVPADRLLVIRTQDIAADMQKLGDFLGVRSEYLDAAGAHSFKGGKKFNLLSRIDEQYLDDKVKRYCQLIMGTYFPEIENFKSWKSARKQVVAN